MGDAGLNLLMNEVVRDAVVMLGDLDVIIEVDPAALPLGILVRFIRQGGERRMIEFLKQFAPTSPPATAPPSSRRGPKSPPPKTKKKKRKQKKGN